MNPICRRLAEHRCGGRIDKKGNKMTTDDLIRAIKKFTVARKCGPKSLQELQEAVVAGLNRSVSDADVREELEKATQVGIVGIDDNGCFVVR